MESEIRVERAAREFGFLPTWKVWDGFRVGDVRRTAEPHRMTVENGYVMVDRYRLSEGENRVDAMALALLQIDDFIQGWEEFDGQNYPEHPDNWPEMHLPMRVRIEGPWRRTGKNAQRMEITVIVRETGITALRGEEPDAVAAFRRFKVLAASHSERLRRAREFGEPMPQIRWGGTAA